MTKKKVMPAAVAVMTAVSAMTPAVSTYAKPVAVEETIGENTETEHITWEAPANPGNSADADSVETEQNDVKIDKAASLLKSAKLTDKIAEENGGKNVMFSPTSLNFALGMLAEGAKGETKEALKEYLGTDDFSAYAKGYLDEIKYYNSDKKTSGYASKLKIADAVWANKDIELKKDFQKSVEKDFAAEVDNLDFTDKDSACKKINDWCDKNTEGLIKEIVTPNAINEKTELCLTNSLYFESGWADGEWNVLDEEEDFVDSEKTTYMTNEADRYYENDKATAFGKGYASGLSFIGILPKEEGDFAMEDLDIDGMLKSTPEYDKVYAKMPKLNFETTASLTDMLKGLGLENIFSDKADFSEISDTPTKVSSILQKTKLELDENGTKAAAVTAAMMEMMSMMDPDEQVVKEVDLTRPFAFAIYDNTNDEVLFLGKVVTVE